MTSPHFHNKFDSVSRYKFMPKSKTVVWFLALAISVCFNSIPFDAWLIYLNILNQAHSLIHCHNLGGPLQFFNTQISSSKFSHLIFNRKLSTNKWGRGREIKTDVEEVYTCFISSIQKICYLSWGITGRLKSPNSLWLLNGLLLPIGIHISTHIFRFRFPIVSGYNYRR